MRSIRDDRHKLIVNLLAGTEVGKYILEGGRVQGEGDSADFIIVDSLEEMNVLETWIGGKKVFDRTEEQ